MLSFKIILIDMDKYYYSSDKSMYIFYRNVSEMIGLFVDTLSQNNHTIDYFESKIKTY